MIVVMVPGRGAPYVLDASAEQLLLLAKEADAGVPHSSSIPPGSYATEFDQAWAVLTKDMVHAQYFNDVNEAIKFYSTERHVLSAAQTGAVIAMLKRVPFVSPDAGELTARTKALPR